MMQGLKHLLLLKKKNSKKSNSILVIEAVDENNMIHETVSLLCLWGSMLLPVVFCIPVWRGMQQTVIKMGAVTFPGPAQGMRKPGLKET